MKKFKNCKILKFLGLLDFFRSFLQGIRNDVMEVLSILGSNVNQYGVK